MHMQQLTLTNNFLLIYKQRLDVTEKYGPVSIKHLIKDAQNLSNPPD